MDEYGAVLKEMTSNDLLFDRMGLNDLVLMAEVNETTSRLAQHTFTSKYSGQIIKILDPYLNGNESVIESNGMITIQHFGIILKTLKSFGHLIPRLEIEYSLLHDVNVTSSIFIVPIR